jgi:hypothetical protein
MSDRPPVDRAAYTIDEFCEAHRISRRKYYDLVEQGIGPRIMRADSKVLISVEAAADWRAEREAATQKAGLDAPEQGRRKPDLQPAV